MRRGANFGHGFAAMGDMHFVPFAHHADALAQTGFQLPNTYRDHSRNVPTSDHECECLRRDELALAPEEVADSFGSVPLEVDIEFKVERHVLEWLSSCACPRPPGSGCIQGPPSPVGQAILLMLAAGFLWNGEANVALRHERPDHLVELAGNSFLPQA